MYINTLLSNDVYNFTCFPASPSLPFQTLCGAIFSCFAEFSNISSYSSEHIIVLPESKEPKAKFITIMIQIART